MTRSVILPLASRLLAAGLLSLVVAGACAETKPTWDPAYEKRVGEEAAAELEKEYERVDNPEAIAKLQNMAAVLGANSERKDVKYEIRLVRERKPGPKPEVNAFALPGGLIYVTEGLLNEVQSDDELAAVIAHEITHNAHYDGLVLAAKANKVFKREIAAVLATILLSGFGDSTPFLVMQAGEYYRRSVLGGYSVEMERRADRGGARAMLGTPWSPVGLLTFMERLAAEERRNPPPEMGIYKTHPLSVERVRYLIEALEEMDVPVNRRLTTKWVKPVVEERTINGKPAQAVTWHGYVVFACDSPSADGTEPAARASQVAAALTEVLAQGAQLFSFSVGQHNGKPALLGAGEVIFVVEEADAALVGKSANLVATDGFQALRAALAKEHLERLY